MLESSSLYEFGPFSVQPAERLLARGGRPVSVTPKAFDLLVYLVDRPGKLVGKQELMAALWPDTFVEEANLAYTVSAVRKALSSGQSEDEYIQTVPTRGYRFVAPVMRKAAPSTSAPASSIIQRLRRRSSVIVFAAALCAAFGAVALARWARRPAVSPAAQRLSVELGADAKLPSTDAACALSADGALLAFAARSSGRPTQLYLRRLEQLVATPLRGTDGASSPFFSPDGQWVAFFAESKLKRVPVTGGLVETLADAPNPRGGWWGEDGTIVFVPGYREGLRRVSASGGPTQQMTTLTTNEISHRFPQVLPGGRAVLYTASTAINIGADSMVVVQPLPSGERIVVQRGAFFGRYVASGHVVYMQDDALFAIPFDGRRLEVTGPAGRFSDAVSSDRSRGSAQLAVSQMGTLAYLPGANVFAERPVGWMDRKGTLAVLRDVPADWSNPEFSPDGHRIAMDIRGEGHSDIWVYDWSQSRMTRVTFESTHEEYPVWTPDGRRIVYRSFKSSVNPASYTLAWKQADGTGEAQVLARSNAALIPGSWHPTRNLLAYVAETTTTGYDVMILPIEGDESSGWKPGQPTAVVNTVAREWAPAFSPDGKWLAYHSAASWRGDLFVQPYPGPGERVTVSSGGSGAPSWSRSRAELVFAAPAFDYWRELMVASYSVENGSFRADKPRRWAEREVPLRLLMGQRNYALHPDGVRVAIAPPDERDAAGQAHITLIFNFFDELRRIAPANP